MEDVRVTLSLALRRVGLFPAASAILRLLTRQRERALRLYTQFAGPGDLCFDIGAHAGERTAIFAALGASVVAVEPVPSSVETLRRRFRANPRVTIVESAVSAAEGRVSLWVSKGTSELSTTSQAWIEQSRFSRLHPWADPIAVPATTIDALIERFGIPRFCKIDVEGSEAEALRGLSVPIPALSFEFSADTPSLTSTCLDRLRSIGPIVCNWSYAETFRLHNPEWLSPEALLAQLRGSRRGLWGDVYTRIPQ